MSYRPFSSSSPVISRWRTKDKRTVPDSMRDILRRRDAIASIAGQFLRYGLVGGFTTLLWAIVYSPLAKFEVTSPQVANFFGYLAAMAAGYVLHSRWSFGGHGQRDNLARTSSRFFLTSLVSYGLNALFVFVLTDSAMLDGPWWGPVMTAVFVTPVIVFTLHRQWVFN
jgi:putative flippase GtrA